MADTATSYSTPTPFCPNAGALENARKYVKLPERQTPPVLADFVFKLVKCKARQIVGKAGFLRDDIKDIEQDLILDLLEHLPQYDSNLASYETFVSRVVDRKVCNLLRHYQMEKRDHRRVTCSVDDFVDDDSHTSRFRMETLSQDEYDRRVGKHCLSAEDRMTLQIDMEDVLVDLPPDLRRTAELLKTMSINQAASEMNLSYSTFYEKYVLPLRQKFEDKDMLGYLM